MHAQKVAVIMHAYTKSVRRNAKTYKKVAVVMHMHAKEAVVMHKHAKKKVAVVTIIYFFCFIFGTVFCICYYCVSFLFFLGAGKWVSFLFIFLVRHGLLFNFDSFIFVIVVFLFVVTRFSFSSHGISPLLNHFKIKLI